MSFSYDDLVEMIETCPPDQREGAGFTCPPDEWLDIKKMHSGDVGRVFDDFSTGRDDRKLFGFPVKIDPACEGTTFGPFE